MSINVVSTTNPKEAEPAALGDLAKSDKDVDAKEKSASAEEQDENTEASDALEAKEGAKDSKEEDDNSEKESTEEKPKQSGFKKRIDKLNKRVSDREREIEYWKSEALKRPQSQEKSKAEEPAVTGKPKADDFETHDAFVEALTDWKVDQKDKAREVKSKETQLKSEFQKQQEGFQAKLSVFKETTSDWDDVVEEVSDIPMSLAVQDIILNTENGPELAYALAKDRQEYKRICALSPLAAAREIGKFEVRIAKESSAESKEVKTTKAPTPIKTVGSKSGAGAKKSIYDADLSQAEYERLRAEQTAKRAQGFFGFENLNFLPLPHNQGPGAFKWVTQF